MLSCKEFVQQTADMIENQPLSLGQKVSNRFHMFICHHCRNYFKQAKTTATVAKSLELEPAPDQIVEQTITKMKRFSEHEQQPK